AFGVARQTENFQTVLQRGRNGVQNIRRRNEEDFREVVLNVEVVILKRVVLFGVENFQKRRRRVAAEISAELVNLVEEDDRVHRSRLLHHLNYLAGQRADVRAAVAANLGLVAHAAQREADELSSGRARD